MVAPVHAHKGPGIRPLLLQGAQPHIEEERAPLTVVFKCRRCLGFAAYRIDIGAAARIKRRLPVAWKEGSISRRSFPLEFILTG